MSTLARGERTNLLRQPARPRTLLRLLIPLVPLAGAFLLQALASRNSQFVERYYSQRIFPSIIHSLSLINGLVRFSIAEVAIYVLAVAMVFALIYQGREIYLRRKRLIAVLRSDLLVLMWTSGLAIWFYLLIWGLNYQREPIGVRLGVAVRTASNDQLKKISETIVNGVNSNYDLSHQGVVGDSRPGPLDRSKIYELIESAYQREPLVGSAGPGRFGPPKPIYFSGLMSRLGISGFYMPFTGEPNFNAAQPDFDMPYAIAHEKAHQRGLTREDEANFLAFVVCVNSPHPYLRYSGYLNALKVVAAYGGSDPEFYKTITAQIGDGPKKDLETRWAFWARTEGPARKLAHGINDSYLKANRIESGMQNYEEDVALIVAYMLMRSPSDRN